MNDLRLALLVVGILILVAIYFYGRWEMRRKEARGHEVERRQEPIVDTLNESTEAPERVDGKDSPGEETLSIESSLSVSSQTPAERKEEEELLDDLDDLAALVEEANEHLPEKSAKRAEVMPMKEVKKSRFMFPQRWMKTKPKVELAPQPEEESETELIIVLTVVAHGKNLFRGEEIVQFLEEKGLRYGEMDIFHAYSPGGRPVFSVANIVEPGAFDLQRVDSLVTPGLTLFLRLPGPAGGFAAFDALLETAQMLAEKLNGEIRDERRNVLTTQAIQQTRERILAFNRTRRTVGV